MASGKKKVVVVMPALPATVNLERFHGDAVDSPLYTIVTWSTTAPQSSMQSSNTERHRRTRQLAIAHSTQQLMELQRISPPENSRSWFVGNTVQQDGSLIVWTPMDPLFVLLNSCWHQRQRFTSLSDLLAQDQNTWWLLLKCVTKEKIALICDIQNNSEEELGSLYVQASEAKIRIWLTGKVTRVAATLANQAAKAQKQQNAGSNGAVDSHFHLPDQQAQSQEATDMEIDASKYHREAIDVVGNYLPSKWIDLLCKEFKVAKEVEVVRAVDVTPTNQLNNFSRFDRRLDPNQPPSSTSKRSTSSTTSSAKKKSKLANVDRTGMKSLTAFFGTK